MLAPRLRARPGAARSPVGACGPRQRPCAPGSARRRRGGAPAAAGGNGGERAPMKAVLELLCDRQDLTETQAEDAMVSIMTAEPFSPEQAAAFLVLLRAKGETPAEVAGLARAMMAEVLPVSISGDVVDIVGTGGDGIGSVNISTGACVVAAAAGARVAKHGGRSVSSLCGSADVVEALGVALDLGPAGVARCVEEAGLGFMLAPRYHPGMARLRPVRGALKVRTVANMLGPLLNPARAGCALVGVFSPDVSELMADSLLRLGVTKALVVHSCGLDELTPMGPADVVEATAGHPLKRYSLDPRDVGIPRCDVADLAGGDAPLNARILSDVFGGARGAVADALNLNAGYALAAAGLAASPVEGVAMAQEAQRAGRAGDVLRNWVRVSNEAAAQEAAAAAPATTAAA
ncbi:PAT1 [Scenedesmus sp. PABB004]|nr:PAT1 [Scenedesmus sp. PABB004]